MLLPGLSFLQLNANHCRAAMSNLVIFIQKNNVDIIALQDPYILEDRLFGFPRSWAVYFSESKNACIIITKREFAVIRSLTSPHSVFINISVTKTSVISMGSFYSPPSSDLAEDLLEWADKPQLNRKALVVMGDFNAHDPSWGNKHTDVRGREVLNLLAALDLVTLNDPSQGPSFSTQFGKSNPDLTIASPILAQKIANWTIHHSISLSDHESISFTLSSPVTVMGKYRYQTKFSTFRKFKSLLLSKENDLSRSLNIVHNKQQLDDHISYLTTVLKTIADKSFKLKSISYTPSVTWWSPALRAQRNKVHALFKRWRRDQVQSTLIQFKKERAQYRRNIQSAKKAAWKRFCDNSSSSYGSVFKLAHSKILLPTDLVHTILLSQDDHPTSRAEVLHHLVNNFFLTSPQQPQSSISTMSHQSSDDSPIFTQHEIKHAIYSCRLNKAPGYDGIDARMLRALFKAVPTYLQKLYNTCLYYRAFPTAWKVAELIFFVKKAKDPHLPSSYRPICLIPVLGKVLEKLLKLRLHYFLETTSSLHPAQHAFRENHSAETLLFLINEKIQEVKKSFKYRVLVSFDIQGAFDSADWSVILQRLFDKGTPKYLYDILSDYLSSRKIALRCLSDLEYYDSYRGCPQGSCLGPLLWLIVADVVLSDFQSGGTTLWAYADDYTMLITGNSRRDLERNAKDAITTFLSLCQRAKIRISPNKTQALLIGPPRQLLRPPILKLGSDSIKFTPVIKILGLFFDMQQNWLHHLKYLRIKLSSQALSLAKFAPRGWGIRGSLLKIWYTSVYQRQLAYASSSWIACLNVHGRRLLDSAQRQILVRISRCYATTSTQALRVLLGIPPIYNYLLSQRELFLLFQFAHISPNLSSYITMVDSSQVQLSGSRFYLSPSSSPNFTVLSPSLSPPSTEVVIFTDGSRHDSGVAAAFCAYTHSTCIYEWSRSLRTLNSIYQAELTAIMAAFSWASDSQFCSALIRSDSQSAVAALRNIFTRDTQVQEIIQTTLNSNKRFFLQWVKAHAGILGNERADVLANEKVRVPDQDPLLIKQPKSNVKHILHTRLIREWQIEWDASTVGRDTYAILPTISTNHEFTNRALNCFITGHGPFPAYLMKIGKSNSVLCRCGAEGTALHYLFHCPLMPERLRPPKPSAVTFWFSRATLNPLVLHRAQSIFDRLSAWFA